MNANVEGKVVGVVEEKRVGRIGDRVEKGVKVRVMGNMNEERMDGIGENGLGKELYYGVGVVRVFTAG
ncbi:sigma 54-interacting transcriptional regulator, partial [Priestia megaterium]|uniref:sigma 54-interacting transcriptional regulator n=1 Tax=Priestia megaterium TaxID=1404 RepID=UPI0021C16BBC